MSDWPKDYMRLPLPTFQGTVTEVNKLRWEGFVADRARIHDPDFHGGKTEAIRMVVGWKEEEIQFYGGRSRTGKTRVIGEWIEFRNFKEANAFVQAWKRLSE